jgi:mannose-6-phosphate isomerase-like protein (cupin superfamily)
VAQVDGPSPVTARSRGGLEEWVPGLRALREYRRAWLAGDVVAGLVLTALLVPVGMGYAQAAGLPPITGLYATIVPLVAYAAFGPSRVMVLGPDSSLAAVIAAVILPLGGDDPETAVALAGALAVLTGLIILVAGIARLGFVTELLSRPVQLGYLCGIAVTILVGQLPRLCGFSVEGRGLLTESRDFLQGVSGGQVNRAALGVGLAGIVVILVLRRLWPAVPGVMVAVVVGIAAVAMLDLDAEGVKVIGVLPQGLPAPPIPAVDLAGLGALFGGALGIALVAVADTTVLSQSLAAQRGETVDPDQELRALGAANLAAGLFQGFAISSSASRTPVAVAAGARSQLTPLVGAVTIALLLVLAPGALRDLPLPMLAAIVICAAIGLIEVAAVRRLYRVRRSEFVLLDRRWRPGRCARSRPAGGSPTRPPSAGRSGPPTGSRRWSTAGPWAGRPVRATRHPAARVAGVVHGSSTTVHRPPTTPGRVAATLGSPANRSPRGGASMTTTRPDLPQRQFVLGPERVRVTILTTGAETGGRHDFTDSWLPAGSMTPLHLHTRYEERLWVASGSLTVWAGPDKTVLRSGDYYLIPTHVPHTI